MNFAHISSKLNINQVNAASHKFVQLITELALRNNNQHVGSGLGGNNFQFMVLSGIKHSLSSNPKRKLLYSHDELVWGADWLSTTDMRDIRIKLDKVFAKIVERQKVMALALEALAKTPNLRDTLEDHKEQFPALMRCLQGSSYYSFDPKLSNVEQLILACIICQDLAHDLDQGITTKVQYLGAALYDFTHENILFSIRNYIRIQRLIEYNLDLDPVFWKALKKVNDLFF